ncbi:MAG: class I SAM-dependent methyltransferase [Acidimicrobiales bacterium]
MPDELNVSDSWRLWRQRVDLDEYHTRWDRLAAEGASVHDEADLVCVLDADRIVDAGCGTGRVAVELARRGKTVVGVDNDVDMLDLAIASSDDVRWILADLATVDLEERFDLVLVAGDVLNYVAPGYESMVVSNLARHLESGGLLVCGGSLAEPDQLTHYDNWCRAAGLELQERYASWNGVPYDRPGHYAVSIHRRS